MRTIGRTLLAGAAVALALLFATFAGSASARPYDAAGLGAKPAAAKAPKVTTQPTSKTVEENQFVSFTASASGTPTPTIQWERSTDSGATWHPIEGATSTSLLIASAKPSENGNQLRAVFTNEAGQATSSAATLTVRKRPQVTQQPLSVIVEAGQSATFEASASGFPAPTVQWQTSIKNGPWTPLAGATSNALTIASVKASENGVQFRAVFTNAAGEDISASATLTVQEPPHVTKQPTSIAVNEGQSATFEATAAGSPNPTEQWEVSTDGGSSWAQVPGATTSQLTIASPTGSQDGYRYRAAFSNAAGSVTSTAATLTVHAAPTVTLQPLNVTVLAGQSASFEATGSGSPTPTQQWEVSADGGNTWNPIAGATASRLTITAVQTGENGHAYRAVFKNSAGSAASAAAVLTVASHRYSAFGWGQDTFGQLGDGLSESTGLPVPVHGLQFVTALAAGLRHSLALLADGTVMAWGAGGHGQLGDESSVGSNVPVVVQGLSGVKAIAAGGSQSFALLANGTVMAWGDNESGQLGTGNGSDAELPVPVKGLTGVTAIAAGEEHTLALLANGTVMAWGSNEFGQLGTGNSKSSNAPVAVKGLSGVKAIAAGDEFSLALMSDGTVKGWGSDQDGQLAHPSTEAEEETGTGVEQEGFSDTPVSVGEGTLTGVSAIAAGRSHVLALLANATVMGWGENSSGQVGNGTIALRQRTPVPVSGLSGVTAISAGGRDSAALLGSGSVVTWGANKMGQLGDGAMDEGSDVPVAVSGLNNLASVSVGGVHMLAFGEPVPTVTGVSPKLGPAAGGATVTITGSDLASATAVKFGSKTASFTVESANTIIATAPAGSATVDVTVIAPAGTSPVSSADRFTYLLAPSIKSLSTKSGPLSGATSVTISGSEFNGTTAVSFGGVPASQFTVNSPSTITAIAPPASVAGAVAVTVTTAGGTSATSKKTAFGYAPTVDQLAPSTGPTAGGTSVTVTGTGFLTGSGNATKFKLGKTKVKSVNCTSTTSCTIVVPAHAAGVLDLSATVAKETSAPGAGDQFTYN